MILWNSDPYPNLGTFNTSISSGEPAGDSTGVLHLPVGRQRPFDDFVVRFRQLCRGLGESRKSVSATACSSWHRMSGAMRWPIGDTPLSGRATSHPGSNQLRLRPIPRASWDIRHSFTTSFNYELPFGRGKQFGSSMNRAADAVVGGWQMNGILTLRTGVPYHHVGHQLPRRLEPCMPDYVHGYTGNGNRRLRADALPTSGSIPPTTRWRTRIRRRASPPAAMSACNP